MKGTTIENVSDMKLSMILVLLVIVQVSFFLKAGFFAPKSIDTQTVYGIPCQDNYVNSNHLGAEKWFYTRGNGTCKRIDMAQYDYSRDYRTNHVVYVFELPRSGDGIVVDYSKWQQNAIGFLQFQVTNGKPPKLSTAIPIMLDAKLAYKNHDDPDYSWKSYAASKIERYLNTSLYYEVEHYTYGRGNIPLFELDLGYHNDYLLNIRLPLDLNENVNAGITDIWLTVINPNETFTKLCVYMKTIFFSISTVFLIWYWRRLRLLPRSPALLEYMLLTLGVLLSFLNLPLEYLNLQHNMPNMLLLRDFRQDVFYAGLLSFWIIFVGEHVFQEDIYNNKSRFPWRILGAIISICLWLCLLHIHERSIHLAYPFFFAWITTLANKLALSFIILAGFSAALYTLSLFSMIKQAVKSMDAKKAALPLSMSAAEELSDEVIERFKFVMMATIICASFTFVDFIDGEIVKSQLKWTETLIIDEHSALSIGVYGMWNIYILALMYFYAPYSLKELSSHQLYDQFLTKKVESIKSPVWNDENWTYLVSNFPESFSSTLKKEHNEAQPN